jgi:transposase
MGSALSLRTDYSADVLRGLARRSKDTSQSRRLLSVAAALEGMSRADAARIGGMDRQTLRDWVLRFNEAGPDGLRDNWWCGPQPRLSTDQMAQLADIVEKGPDRVVDGVVRWRRVDLQRVISERFGVDYHERYVGVLLKKIGFSHVSVRPRHPGQSAETITAFKKTSHAR